MKKNMLSTEEDSFKVLLEKIIRLSILGAVSFFCFQIFKPFLILITWGIIIAMGVLPIFRIIKKFFKDNKYLASFLTVVILLMVIALPVIFLAKSFFDGASAFAHTFEAKSLTIPPPKETVKNWPLIGPKVFEIWEEFSKNLTNSLLHLAPYLKNFGIWIIDTLTAIGKEIIYFVLSIFVAGLMLIFENEIKTFFFTISNKLSGKYGHEIINLLSTTTKNVTQGIIGVALAQAILAGTGLLLVGIPHVGLWTFLVFVIQIVQIPILVVMGPIAVYLFFNFSTSIAIGFTVFSLILTFTDTPLRAYFFGRGSVTPMPVIFFGAIGGLIQYGMLGLFIGSLLLALGYRLFLYWLKDGGAR